ncbi:MAG: hypothetical protein ABFR47_01520 [Verrucomicrobiota bacterium]
MKKLNLLLLASVFLFSGCISKPSANDENKPVLPPLLIAQNGDGDVTIEWESETGYAYTIYYQVSADADWKVLRKASRVSGTGERLAVYDRVSPSRPPRRYRILAEKKM